MAWLVPRHLAPILLTVIRPSVIARATAFLVGAALYGGSAQAAVVSLAALLTTAGAVDAGLRRNRNVALGIAGQSHRGVYLETTRCGATKARGACHWGVHTEGADTRPPRDAVAG